MSTGNLIRPDDPDRAPEERRPTWQQQVMAARRGPIGRWAKREQDRSTASLSALIRQLLGR